MWGQNCWNVVRGKSTVIFQRLASVFSDSGVSELLVLLPVKLWGAGWGVLLARWTLRVLSFALQETLTTYLTLCAYCFIQNVYQDFLIGWSAVEPITTVPLRPLRLIVPYAYFISGEHWTLWDGNAFRWWWSYFPSDGKIRILPRQPERTSTIHHRTSLGIRIKYRQTVKLFGVCLTPSNWHISLEKI